MSAPPTPRAEYLCIRFATFHLWVMLRGKKVVCGRGPVRRKFQAQRMFKTLKTCERATAFERREGDPGRGGLQGTRPRAGQLGGPASRGLLRMNANYLGLLIDHAARDDLVTQNPPPDP
eukprot:7496621-Pyramimonas_sp.AAC.1